MILEHTTPLDIIIILGLLFALVIVILGFLMPIFVYSIKKKTTDISSTLTDILSTLENIERLHRIKGKNEEITAGTDIKIL